MTFPVLANVKWYLGGEGDLVLIVKVEVGDHQERWTVLNLTTGAMYVKPTHGWTIRQGMTSFVSTIDLG